MKKLCAGLVALMVLVAVGCAQVPPETNTPPVPDESKTAEVNGQKTSSTTRITTQGKTQEQTGAVEKTQHVTTTAKTKPKFISKDKAKAVAFERAGVNAKDVTRLQIELDYDDDRRIWEYEIDFQVGKMEYDICVNAVIGTITSYENEFDAE